jgi:hypothetical protein
VRNPCALSSGGWAPCIAACSDPHPLWPLPPPPNLLPGQVLFSWSGRDAATSAPWPAVPAGSSQKTLLVPGPVPAARHGARGVVTLTAAIDGADAAGAASASVVVVAVGSPLVAALKGPSDFREAATVVLSAADSYDPDGGFLGGLYRRLAWRALP